MRRAHRAARAARAAPATRGRTRQYPRAAHGERDVVPPAADGIERDGGDDLWSAALRRHERTVLEKECAFLDLELAHHVVARAARHLDLRDANLAARGTRADDAKVEAAAGAGVQRALRGASAQSSTSPHVWRTGSVIRSRARRASRRLRGPSWASHSRTQCPPAPRSGVGRAHRARPSGVADGPR